MTTRAELDAIIIPIVKTAFRRHCAGGRAAIYLTCRMQGSFDSLRATLVEDVERELGACGYNVAGIYAVVLRNVVTMLSVKTKAMADILPL